MDIEERQKTELEEEQEYSITCHRDDTLNQVNSRSNRGKKQTATPKNRRTGEKESPKDSSRSSSDKKGKPRAGQPASPVRKSVRETTVHSSKASDSISKSRKLSNGDIDDKISTPLVNGNRNSQSARTSARLKSNSRLNISYIEDIYVDSSDMELDDVSGSKETRGNKSHATHNTTLSSVENDESPRRRSQRNATILSPHIDYFDGTVRSPRSRRCSSSKL